ADHVFDEGADDLEKIHLQIFQVGEGGKATAEVVEDEVEAHLPQDADELHRLAEVAHGCRFSDLEENSLRRDAGGLDLRQHVVEEGVVAHRLTGEVDGEAGGVAVGEGAAGQGHEGGVDHPAVDGGDEVVALGGGDESAGARDAPLLVDHADEDLAQRRLAAVAAQGVDALPVEAEAMLGEGLVDAVDPLHLAVALGESAVVRLVLVHPVAAALLGDVAGGVGGGEHLGHVAALGSDGDEADGDADLEDPLLPAEAVLPHGAAQPLAELAGVLQAGVFEQDPELVAAQPGQGIALAHHGLQKRGDLLEHLVARQMAAGVVDHLELVEVEIEESVLALLLPGAVEAELETLLELPAVDQAGERVVAGEVDHLPLQAPELGDVLEDEDAAGGVALAVLNRSHGIAQGELLAVAAHQHRVAAVLGDPPLEEAALDGVVQRLAGRLVDDVENQGHGLAAGFLQSPAGETLGHGVEVVDHAQAVGTDDAVTDRGEGHLRQLLLLCQGLLGEAALDLGGGAGGEDLEDGDGGQVLRRRLCAHHRDVPQEPVVAVVERYG